MSYTYNVYICDHARLFSFHHTGSDVLSGSWNKQHYGKGSLLSTSTGLIFKKMITKGLRSCVSAISAFGTVDT